MTQNHLNLLTGEAFHVDISGNHPVLVSRERGIRVDLARLSPTELLRLKDMAHNQYVKAMLFSDEDADVHRATLNYVSRHLERMGNPANLIRPNRARRRPAPTRAQAA
ncbi:MAG: hypothetical protein RIE53_08445 [Rhodothermales bacterium]